MIVCGSNGVYVSKEYQLIGLSRRHMLHPAQGHWEGGVAELPVHHSKLKSDTNTLCLYVVKH